MDKTNESRRDFLRLAALAGAAFVGGGFLSSCGQEAPEGHFDSTPAGGGGPGPGLVMVYKLFTHKKCACNACKGHAANKVFASMNAANLNRPHLACNCTVKTYVIDFADWQAFFGGGQQVYDYRW